MMLPEGTLVMHTMFAALDDDGWAEVPRKPKPHKDGGSSVAASQIPKTSPGSPVVADIAVTLRTILGRRLQYRQAATTAMITNRRHVPLASPAMAPLDILPELFPGELFSLAAEDGPMDTSEGVTMLIVEDIALFEGDSSAPFDALTLPEDCGTCSGAALVWPLELPER